MDCISIVLLENDDELTQTDDRDGETLRRVTD